MSKAQLHHPEDDQLLRYVDGELPARKAGQVRLHLEACWQCRVELEELHDTVGECVRYRKNVLERHLPPPPAPWIDIYQRFAEIDASPEPDFFERIARALHLPRLNARIWAAAAVALLVICVLFYRFRLTPSVQAAELLRKAIVAADTHPLKPRLLQIRTREHQVTRPAGPARKLAANSADAGTLNSLQTLFQAANYDWDDPLSAKSYQAWRDRLADKQDQVVEERDAFRIRTNTGSGELMQASLTLRTQDLRPVEGRFEFRNQEWVEITAVDDTTLPADTIAGAHIPAPEISAKPPSLTPGEAPVSAPARAATLGDELHVLAALHQAGADLGEPIEVSRSGGEIVVTGVGIAPQRQQEIRNLLGSEPHVVVRFSDAAPPRVQPERALADSPAGADIRQLQARIADQIGGRTNFEQLAGQVLDLTEPMMSRAYALRRLAERFPGGAESQLSTEDRRLLRRLQQEHTAALRQLTVDIGRVLAPVLPRGTPRAVTSAGAWQPATEELFQSARQVEKLSAMLFGAAPGESAGDQLPAQLMSSLAELRSRLDSYDRLSATILERSDR